MQRYNSNVKKRGHSVSRRSTPEKIRNKLTNPQVLLPLRAPLCCATLAL